MQTVPRQIGRLCQSFSETATMSSPSSGCQTGSSLPASHAGADDHCSSARSVSPSLSRRLPCPFPPTIRGNASLPRSNWRSTKRRPSLFSDPHSLTPFFPSLDVGSCGNRCACHHRCTHILCFIDRRSPYGNHFRSSYREAAPVAPANAHHRRSTRCGISSSPSSLPSSR